MSNPDGPDDGHSERPGSATDGGFGRRGVLRGLLTGAAVAAGGASVTAAGDGSSDAFSTEVVSIDSFDGTTLAGTLYEPAGAGPHPSVLMTHGWGQDRDAAYVRRTAEPFARNGYVVLAYDSRGFGESDGEVGVDGPNEVADARYLISRLAAHDAVRTADGNPENPDIGMDSLSYAGGIQLNVAAVDDRLDAIVPRWTWHDLVCSTAPNGVVRSGWASLLLHWCDRSRRVTTPRWRLGSGATASGFAHH
jgi:predicted acyl esterase